MKEVIENKWRGIYKFFYDIVLPRNQVLILSMVFLAVVLFTYWPATDFHSLERPTRLSHITPQKIAEWGILPTKVDVGLHIINFPTLDFVNNQFVFDGVIWFEFDPALLALETVSKFSFEKGEIIQRSEPNTQIVGNKLFARYDIRVRFTSDLEYALFPFDDHTIFITLVNRTVQPNEMIYNSQPSFFHLSSQIVVSGWDIFGTSVLTGYVESTLDKFASEKIISHPKTVFSIDFRRSGIRNSLLILLPLFLIYFLSLFALSFDPAKYTGSIIALASAGVTSLLSYRYVIENMTPKAIGYFVLSDQLFILLLCATLAEFVFAIFMVSVGKLTRFVVVARGVLFIVTNIVVIASWYYMLYRI